MPRLLLLPTLALLALPLPAFARESVAEDPAPAGPHLSLELEIERAIDAGITYLLDQQADDGSWSNPEHPAFTALAITAILRDPAPGDADRAEPVAEGLAFLLEQQREDGAIVRGSLPNYNTALSMLALAEADDPELLPALARARSWLIASQADYGVEGVHESGLDGGLGYGSDPSHSDLSNTHLGLEALAYSRVVLAESGEGLGGEELDWQAAIDFVSHCQNLPDTNDQPWVAAEESERGGFMYYPGSSKAGEVPGTDNGAQRSYGSMTYAGLLSFLYAEVDRDDPRVLAALGWLQAHYTLEENPRLGMQGYYYYLHTMAKALRAAQVERLVTPDGVGHDWREELALELMRRQAKSGFWVNEDENRWMEDNPVLVTCYALLALEHVHATL